MAAPTTEISDETTRGFILFCVLEGSTNMEIHERLHKVFRGKGPCVRTVAKWAAQFRAGDYTLKDAHRTGRPKNEGLPDAIRKLLDEQPFSSTYTLADELGVSRKTVSKVLTHDLKLKRYISRWVPHTLTDGQKLQRVETAKQMLSIVNSPSANLIITSDESWFYYDYHHDGKWAHSAAKLNRNQNGP